MENQTEVSAMLKASTRIRQCDLRRIRMLPFKPVCCSINVVWFFLKPAKGKRHLETFTLETQKQRSCLLWGCSTLFAKATRLGEGARPASPSAEGGHAGGKEAGREVSREARRPLRREGGEQEAGRPRRRRPRALSAGRSRGRRALSIGCARGSAEPPEQARK